MSVLLCQYGWNMREQQLPRLTPRLEMIVSGIRTGSTVADIGTDHGYVPIHLIKRGIAKKVFASDVNIGPIESAKKNIHKFEMDHGIITMVANGLAGVEEEPVDTVVIAGMGGEIISQILQASTLAKKQGVTFILQPMTAYEELKRYLFSNGYRITQERICREGEKFYTILWVENGEEPHKDRIYEHIGYHVFHSEEAICRDFLQRKKDRYLQMKQGMAKSKEVGNTQKLEEINLVLEKIEERKVGDNVDKGE